MEPVAGISPWSMQMQVVKALCSGERKKASDLLLDFGYRSRSLKADDFVGILKYCARSPDPLVCQIAWSPNVFLWILISLTSSFNTFLGSLFFISDLQNKYVKV